MINFEHHGHKIQLRATHEADLPALRILLNESYQELAEKGWNYTASYQDEDITRQRISKGRAFVLELNGQLIATILFYKSNLISNKNTAYVGQFAVKTQFKKNGFGNFLMDYCENLAKTEGFDGIQLDTAQPAVHLVNWYLKRGYSIVGETKWEGKTYESYVFEKIF